MCQHTADHLADEDGTQEVEQEPLEGLEAKDSGCHAE